MHVGSKSLWLALVSALAMILPACADRTERSIEGAVDYFGVAVDGADPSWASLFGYLHRRFGIEAFDARGRPLHEASTRDPSPEARVYRRLDDPTATVSVAEVERLATVVDRMTAAALHCDRLPLPDSWGTILGRATEVGGYALTHAALALQWTIENGCSDWAALADLRERQVEALVDLADRPESLARTFDTPTDLWLEAMAMLDYLGAGARIRREWIERVVEIQRPDGGWPLHPAARTSDPHPTALALWVLLGHARPEAVPRPWIARSAANGAPRTDGGPMRPMGSGEPDGVRSRQIRLAWPPDPGRTPGVDGVDLPSRRNFSLYKTTCSVL